MTVGIERSARPTWRRSAERRLRRCLLELPAPLRERLRAMRFRAQTLSIRPAVVTVRPPGEGPVIALDARGVPWSDVVAALESRDGAPERVIVVTDQPVMHVARDTSAIVEFVPPDNDASFAIARFVEIARVYGVERWEPFPEMGAA